MAWLKRSRPPDAKPPKATGVAVPQPYGMELPSPGPCPICRRRYGLKKIDGEWTDLGHCPDCLPFAWLADRIVAALKPSTDEGG